MERRNVCSNEGPQVRAKSREDNNKFCKVQFTLMTFKKKIPYATADINHIWQNWSSSSERKKEGVYNFLKTIEPYINQACCKLSLGNKDTILLK